MRIGDAIHLRRRYMKMTILELAKKSGVHRNCISRIENNTANPTLETLQKVCSAIGCELTFDFHLLPAAPEVE